MKVSAVAPERHVIEAPVRVFHDQEEVKRAFRAGEFTGDTVVVVRFQGPKANGMPELHSLTPVARGAAGPRAEGGAGHRRADVGGVAARCRRRSTSARRRWTAGRWRGCTTATG